MKKEIVLRVINEADFMIKNQSTVRDTAKVFFVSKSTVHYDLKFKLKKIDKSRWERVKKILAKNLSLRHIRGGIATREKYKILSKKQ